MSTEDIQAEPEKQKDEGADLLANTPIVLRVESDGTPAGTRVFDETTGRTLINIAGLTFKISANDSVGVLTLDLHHVKVKARGVIFKDLSPVEEALHHTSADRAKRRLQYEELKISQAEAEKEREAKEAPPAQQETE